MNEEDEIKIQRAISLFRELMDHEKGFNRIYSEYTKSLDELKGDALKEFIDRMKEIRKEYK